MLEPASGAFDVMVAPGEDVQAAVPARRLRDAASRARTCTRVGGRSKRTSPPSIRCIFSLQYNAEEDLAYLYISFPACTSTLRYMGGVTRQLIVGCTIRDHAVTQPWTGRSPTSARP